MDDKLRGIIDKIKRASSPSTEDLAEAMRGQMARVKLRTRVGLDVDGRPFAPKKDGSPSHLWKTGTLLTSLTATAEHGDFPSELKGRVSVTGKARAYAGKVNSKRRFLGASEEDRRQVVASLRESLRSRRSGG